MCVLGGECYLDLAVLRDDSVLPQVSVDVLLLHLNLLIKQKRWV